MPLPETSLQLGPWSGGVRYDVPVEEVGAHELNDMENTRLGTADQIEQRKGTLSYNSLGAVNSAATLTMAASRTRLLNSSVLSLGWLYPIG